MQPLTRSTTASPFAVHFSFTANYSLDICKDRLLDIQRTPSKLMRMLGGAYLQFIFSSVDADLYEFSAKRRVNRTKVHARGYLKKFDDQATEIVGYADAGGLFYAALRLLLVIGLLIAVRFYNGTPDGLYVSTAIALMFLASTVANAFIIRRHAKRLARIIEETLRNHQHAVMQP